MPVEFLRKQLQLFVRCFHPQPAPIANPDNSTLNMNTKLPTQETLGAAVRRLFGSLALFSAVLFSTASLRADTLALYDMQTAGARTNASLVGSGLTATSLTGNNLASGSPGSATLASAPTDFYTTWAFIGAGGTTDANAISSGDYFKLTLAPTAGNSITLSSLSFDVFAATAGPSARQIYLFSDKTGFAGGSELFSGGTQSGSPLIPYNTASAGQNFSIDLSGNAAFANITDSVTFRFYTQTPTASQGMAFDDITINGTVSAVPEPSSFVFFGLGILAFLRVAHHRRQA